MLDANDQLFHLAGAQSGVNLIRLGLSSLFAEKFLEKERNLFKNGILVYADHSSVISKGVAEGYMDVGFFFTSKPTHGVTDYELVKEIDWPLQCVRARSRAVLSPGRRHRIP